MVYSKIFRRQPCNRAHSHRCGRQLCPSINVIVDNTPPSVLLNLTNGTEFYSDEKWTVDFTADDSLSGIDTAVFTIDGTEWLKGDVLKETEFGKFKRDGCGCKVKV